MKKKVDRKRVDDLEKKLFGGYVPTEPPFPTEDWESGVMMEIHHIAQQNQQNLIRAVGMFQHNQTLIFQLSLATGFIAMIFILIATIHGFLPDADIAALLSGDPTGLAGILPLGII